MLTCASEGHRALLFTQQSRTPVDRTHLFTCVHVGPSQVSLDDLPRPGVQRAVSNFVLAIIAHESSPCSDEDVRSLEFRRRLGVRREDFRSLTILTIYMGPSYAHMPTCPYEQ